MLAPTRELAAQIVADFKDLAKHTKLRAAAVYGGVGMAPQEQALRRGVDLIVACPGRLLDHMTRDYAALRNLEILVLDEADRMLDMGFLPDIRRILKQIPKPDQTLLFSATMPKPIVELSRHLLKDPAVLNIERRSAPAAGIDQAIFQVRQDLKPALLHHLLQGEHMKTALVFTRTKHRANRLAQYLDKRGVACERIHGNRSQAQRTKALDGFKNGRYRVLVATDVAARGIDIDLLSHVVNFDVPNMPEDYIHRVGRTARAGATGEAYTFVSPQEMNDLAAIERAVGKKLTRRQAEDFNYEEKPNERFEIPIQERIAAIRSLRSEERARARAKKERQGGASEQGARRGRGTSAAPPAAAHRDGSHRPARPASGRRSGRR